eukprot:CAMPEP_0172308332 /NCGR_PEP_ID=MMETSP1058-20130122/8956_1 /TAXON_ID=83371 /ORGANISM="Detonula confervacea, Strain CCMP 353" /LENGTH=252 /DNA_ID=CAMNT_0013020717 /DNA_START=998 /DNA_END=1757 /DNA_ORIENTATION=+
MVSGLGAISVQNAVIKASAFSRPPANGVVNCQHASSAGITHRQLNHPLFSSNNNDDTANLLEKARRLRQEVSAIESTKMEKQQVKDAEERARQAEEREAQKQKDKQRMRYSAEVPILKDMGDEIMERVDFPPRLKGGKSRIVTIQAPLPLGLVLGEDASMPGLTSVDEVAPDGNGASADIKQGDIVRAVTACQTTMETPTWQLIAGGIGQPKTKRFIYSVDGRPLEEVLDAIGSNRMDVQGRDAWLVLERMD